jgi:hypothetical protein
MKTTLDIDDEWMRRTMTVEMPELGVNGRGSADV